jgi:hypothetical protein
MRAIRHGDHSYVLACVLKQSSHTLAWVTTSAPDAIAATCRTTLGLGAAVSENPGPVPGQLCFARLAQCSSCRSLWFSTPSLADHKIRKSIV